MKLIGDKQKIKRIDNSLVEKLNRRYPVGTKPKLEEDESKKEKKRKHIITKDFSLEDKTNHYLITGFKEGDNPFSYRLYKELLPSQTQDDHAQHAIEVGENEPHLEDISQYHSIFNTLHNNKDSKYKDIIEELRQFIKQSMIDYWLTTLTRIRYTPAGDDIIIHNYKQPNQSQDSIKFIGPDGYITKPKTTNIVKPLQSLLNTSQSPEEINQIYKWFTDVNAYIWRLNSKPEETTEKVARLNADSDGAVLNCSSGPSGSSDGLGVQKIFHKK